MCILSKSHWHSWQGLLVYLPGFVRGFVNGKVLLLLVMLNPHKVMAKPHQYYRRGTAHLLF